MRRNTCLVISRFGSAVPPRSIFGRISITVPRPVVTMPTWLAAASAPLRRNLKTGLAKAARSASSRFGNRTLGSMSSCSRTVIGLCLWAVRRPCIVRRLPCCSFIRSGKSACIHRGRASVHHRRISAHKSFGRRPLSPYSTTASPVFVHQRKSCSPIPPVS